MNMSLSKRNCMLYSEFRIMYIMLTSNNKKIKDYINNPFIYTLFIDIKRTISSSFLI